MLRFRRLLPCPVPPDTPLSVEVVERLAVEVLAPRHFYLAPELTLEFVHRPAEELAWEVFRGRLLDPAHTRPTRTFASWNLYLVEKDSRSGEPLFSLKLDAGRGELHVVRGLLCRVWEGYDAGGNVILSRETTRWVRELAGTIDLARFTDAGHLLDELAARL